jgi:hypothetical protein
MAHPRRFARSAALALVIAAATPSATSACSSESPTFIEAVRGASAIARVSIIDRLGDPPHTETYRVERVLKGSLPAVVTVSPAWANLCHDTVAFYAGEDGSDIIVAIGMTYYGQIINPVWVLSVHGIDGSAGVPDGVRTLPELERAILRALAMPDTATAEPINHVPGQGLALAVLAGLLAFIVIVRRRSTSGDIPAR